MLKLNAGGETRDDRGGRGAMDGLTGLGAGEEEGCCIWCIHWDIIMFIIIC